MTLRHLWLSSFLAVLLGSFGCASKKVTGPPIDKSREATVDQIDELIRLHQSQMEERDLDSTYTIGPGDVLTINLIGRSDIFGPEPREITVTDNPMFYMPHIGEMRIHGKTKDQLEADMKEAYGDFIVDPKPSVLINKYQNNRVMVIGLVERSDEYPLEPGELLLDAILKAGGISKGGRGGAPGRYLRIYRQRLNRTELTNLSPEEVLERIQDGNMLVSRDEIPVPIEDYLKTGSFQFNIPLQPNDIVYVPAAGAVNVYGRVVSPGVVFMGPGVRTVNQVLTERGGMEFGAKSDIDIIRHLENGEREVYKIDARKISKREERDFLLEDGDELWVYTHPLRTVGEFMSALIGRTTNAGVNATYSVSPGPGAL